MLKLLVPLGSCSPISRCFPARWWHYFVVAFIRTLSQQLIERFQGSGGLPDNGKQGVVEFHLVNGFSLKILE